MRRGLVLGTSAAMAWPFLQVLLNQVKCLSTCLDASQRAVHSPAARPGSVTSPQRTRPTTQTSAGCSPGPRSSLRPARRTSGWAYRRARHPHTLNLLPGRRRHILNALHRRGRLVPPCPGRRSDGSDHLPCTNFWSFWMMSMLTPADLFGVRFGRGRGTLLHRVDTL